MRDASFPARGAWIEIKPPDGLALLIESFPARGAWIEIRGSHIWPLLKRSFPARGAWIEISYNVGCHRDKPSRSPQGERGLKYPRGHPIRPQLRRSPQGERGLKSTWTCWAMLGAEVVPRKGSVD